MSITIFQHEGAPAWQEQIEKHPLVFGDPTQWDRNNEWDGSVGWSRDLFSGLWMPSNDVVGEVEVRKRVMGSGGQSYSTGIGMRVLEVVGVVSGDCGDVAEWEKKIKSWAVRPFLKLSYEAGSYINLGAFRGIEWERKSSDWARVRISWQIDDPFWYELALTQVRKQGNSELFVFDYGDEDLHCPVYPLVRFDGQAQIGHVDVGTYYIGSGVTMSQRTAGNHTSGPSWSMSNPGMPFYQWVTLDAENGTCLRWSAASSVPDNLIAQFTGEFWPLYPGENQIFYSGPYIYLTFQFRKRWL